ncbi:MAG: LysM peptidoglycan-binding domain-containing protein [Clostridiales bacterium]|nr:LysM peptidoglycan-binding domain-containing protein [Clostridiales bacterium]
MPTERSLNIDIRESTIPESDHFQLPLNFLTVGEVENDDVKVYIHQTAYLAIEKFARSDTSKELGSILLGGYSNYSGKTLVIISDFIEAKHTDASASTLTFTHETWNYVHKEHERLHPELRILGWQHTHPNYSVFLSNYDMFIQENFFNLPFQVAYVVDPIQNIRGFFQWKNNKVEKLKGYFIYDEVGKKISIKPDAKSQKTAKTKTHPLFLIATSLIVAASLMFLTFFQLKQSKRQDELSALILEQSRNMASQELVLKELQNDLANAMVGENLLEAESLKEKLESQQTRIDEQEKIIAVLQEQINNDPKPTEAVSSNAVFVAYTVERGDTLSEICEKLGIDYQANVRIIKALNGIDAQSRIYVGQVLLLPKRLD